MRDAACSLKKECPFRFMSDNFKSQGTDKGGKESGLCTVREERQRHHSQGACFYRTKKGPVKGPVCNDNK